jgi:hypothetical protein
MNLAGGNSRNHFKVTLSLFLCFLTVGCLPQVPSQKAEILLEARDHYVERCAKINSNGSYVELLNKINSNMSTINEKVTNFTAFSNQEVEIKKLIDETQAITKSLFSIVDPQYFTELYTQRLVWAFESEILKENFRSVLREEFKPVEVLVSAVYDWQGLAESRKSQFKVEKTSEGLELVWQGQVNILDLCQFQKAFTVVVEVIYSNGKSTKKRKKRLSVDTGLYL